MSNKLPLFPTHREGVHSRQAHVAPPEGTFEREIGKDGFFGAASHLYHRNPPTAWSRIEGPLQPRAFNLQSLEVTDSPLKATPLLHNVRTRLRYWKFSAGMDHLFRNSDGDDLLFVQQGSGDFYCDFGHLSYEAGDYLVVPRGTMWRVETQVPCEFLMIEATDSAYGLPDRGLVGRHALFDQAVLDTPAINEQFKAQPPNHSWQLHVKRHNQLTTIHYAFNPLDTVGWHGDLSVVRLNVRDIRSLTSHRLHLPPSSATTFLADRFVVCTFTPRLLETDPEAMKLPFFHNNDDYDEVVFNHRGLLGSHPSVGQGQMSFHPSGLTHGPHPMVLPFMYQLPVKEATSYSIMIDARDPLSVSDPLMPHEIAGYADSWKASIAFAPDAPREPGKTLQTVTVQPKVKTA